MSTLYSNTSLYQPVSRPFAFNKRNERIDWRRIAAVDVDRVARELDFQVLQDNIEQITMCNIDLEVDSRAMDPNFLKLYKMAQLTIEYLLLCQDQISSQLTDYEQTKSKSALDHEQYQSQIDKLKNELNLTKKESKKRKKHIETQEKMLLAQRSNYHTCPVCAHAFLTLEYLQGHMQRRHPEYSGHGRREHDVDMEKELQRLKADLQNKETELQLIKVQKAVDEEKIREREETIRQLKDEIQSLTTKITILDEKYFTVRSSTQNGSPSPHRREAGVKELLKENKTLRAENDRLKHALQEAESGLKAADKAKRRAERASEKLQNEINELNNTLRSLQNASGDTSRLSEELITARKRHTEEKDKRKKLQQELDEANDQLARLRDQPPPVTGRKSPTPAPRRPPSPPSRESSPPPAPRVPSPRPIITNEVFLPQYCPSLVRELNRNPTFLNRFRNEAKGQLAEEFAQYRDLGLTDKDTRIHADDFQKKMTIINDTRINIQNDLPNFERIREDLNRTADRLAAERLGRHGAPSTPGRSSGGKIVKFDDHTKRQEPAPARGPSTTVHSKPRDQPPAARTSFASDDEKTNTRLSGSDDDDDYSQRTKSAADIQPSPRRHPPSSAVGTLVAGGMRPSTASNAQTGSAVGALAGAGMRPSATNNAHTPSAVGTLAGAGMRPSATNNVQTVSALVRPKTSTQQYESESDDDDDDESPRPSKVAEKARDLDQRLADISAKGHKPATNAVAQGFRPAHQTVASRNNHDDDDDDLSDPSFTSVGDLNPPRRTSAVHVPQAGARESAGHFHPLSSGDASLNTYDSLMRSAAGKSADPRRPMTADSAKTSNVDSDVSPDSEDDDVD